uniref:Uncharacterized protein n=1 Tax=Amphimedon queenslandica TaxID=400682 RepID=A0A1X7SUB6_AMPQE
MDYSHKYLQYSSIEDKDLPKRNTLLLATAIDLLCSLLLSLYKLLPFAWVGSYDGRVSDNEGLTKDQGRRVPEELLVRRAALSEGGKIETVINIKI